MKTERHNAIRDYAVRELKHIHASVKTEMKCRDVPGRSDAAKTLLDTHVAEALREADERRTREGTSAAAGGDGEAVDSSDGYAGRGRMPGTIVPCDGIVLDYHTTAGRAVDGAAHLGFDVTVVSVVSGKERIDDAAFGGTAAVADEEEISKCIGSIKPAGQMSMVLDLLAPSTLLVGAAFEHIGALGEGAFDLFGDYIPRGLAEKGAVPLPLACPGDPVELTKVLMQAEKVRVLQRVSIVLQRGNARLLNLRADAAAPRRPRPGNPSSARRRRSRAAAVAARSGGGVGGA